MRFSRWCRSRWQAALARRAAWLGACLLIGAASVDARGAAAAEPAREFLEGLRERGFHDTALEYLDWLDKGELCPPDMRRVLTLERAVSTIDGSRRERDAAVRERLLDQAQTLLRDFIAKEPTHPQVPAAKMHLGNLLVERARVRIDRSSRANTAAADKTALLKESRGFYDEALKLFTATKEELKQQLQSLPPIQDESRQQKLVELRDLLRKDYLQAQLLEAAIREETADTAVKGSKDQIDLLKQASEEYKGIAEKYRTLIAGSYAILYRGRCAQKLGDHKAAISFFKDLLEQAEASEAYRDLKIKTLRLAVPSWFDESQKKYAEAANALEKMLDTVTSQQSQTPDWLYLRLSLAQALKKLADELKAAKPTDPQARASLQKAKKHALFVSRFPSDHREDARKLLADLAGVELDEESSAGPQTFAEAKSAAAEALSALQAAQQNLAALPAKIAKEQDANVRRELEAQRVSALQEARELPGQALDNFRLALRLATPETSVEDVQICYYYITYLYFAQGEYLDAAVVGEFFAKRYPTGAGARQSAEIVRAALLKLYNARSKETPPDSQALAFLTSRVIGMCEFMAKEWPADAEGINAADTLIRFMLKDSRFDEAEGYLDQLPADSAARGQLELMAARVIWAYYAGLRRDIDGWEEQKTIPSGKDLAQEKARADSLRQRAQNLMKSGFERVKAGGLVDENTLQGLLLMAQVQFDDNQPEAAWSLLNAEKVGPLTAIKANNAAAKGIPGFLLSTYRTSLGALIGRLGAAAGDAAKQTAILAEIDSTLLSLREQATPQELNATYLALADRLNRQLKDARLPAQKQGLLQGFEKLAAPIVTNSDSFDELLWVGHSFYQMGDSLDTGKALSADAKKYYEQSAAVFEKMVAKAAKAPGWMPDDKRVQVRMRMAMTTRRLGDFEKAINVLQEILTANNGMVNVQVETAQTYQEWAEKANKPDLYSSAVMGTLRDPKSAKNIVWGWNEISKRLQKLPAYETTYYQARYACAWCRYKHALTMPAGEDRKKRLELAKNYITSTHKVYPNLGGVENFRKFEALLKQIQSELGEPQAGLVASKN